MLTVGAAVAAVLLSSLLDPSLVVWKVSAAVWVITLIGVAPVAWFGPRGVLATLYAYFAGAAVRIVLCLVTLVVFIKTLSMPAGTVVFALMGVYLTLLFIEAGQVRRFIMTADLRITREPLAGAAA